MRPLEHVLVELATAVGATERDARLGAGVVVDRACVDVPIEARLFAGGELFASLPRHRLATGFDAPFTRLAAHFAEEAR